MFSDMNTMDRSSHAKQQVVKKNISGCRCVDLTDRADVTS